jgi:hypothetical protein
MKARFHLVWRVAISAPILALLVSLASAPPAFACRCVDSEPIALHAIDPSKAVLVGGIVRADESGVSVIVESWLSGAGASPIVTLRPDGFRGGEAGCGTELPPVGSRWILVLFDWTPGGSGLVNACTPRGDLATPAGHMMLAEAVTALGQGAVPSAPAHSAVETDGIVPVPMGVAGAVLALAALGLASMAWRRSRRTG